jgi:phosphopantetheine--protein transferase-like protein
MGLPIAEATHSGNPERRPLDVECHCVAKHPAKNAVMDYSLRMFSMIQSATCRVGRDGPLEVTAAQLAADVHHPSASDMHRLSQSEIKRAERFRERRDAMAYMGSHILLNTALKELLGEDFDPGEIQRGPRNKPFLPGNPVHFSISRSGTWLAIGICANRPVGIDIETRIDLPNAGEIAHRVLHEQELKTWNALPAALQKEAFTRLWCTKEAILKARGDGFYQDPRAIQLMEENGIMKVMTLPDRYGHPRQWETGQLKVSGELPLVHWAATG